ncbi:hypothetical protein JHK85_014346 [Glycine max]|nr:hypothetical protein JHK85_014346 [Glycine max]
MTIHSVVIQKLLSTNAQVGRRVAAHHLKEFTYGFRNKMAIIDSDKTLICMRSACNFMASLARHNGRFMFINTNPLFDEIFDLMTKKVGSYSPSTNSLWRTGGFLTNSLSPKKFRSRNKKLVFGPTQPPDCIFIVDTERKSSVINEAFKLQIPVVALVDSAMPLDVYKRIAYPPSRAIFTSKADIEETKKLLDKLVVLKFNGSQGRNMCFDGPKSAIDICDGLTYLDLIINQIETLNSKYGSRVPLLLFNKDDIHDSSLKVLEKYSKSSVEVHTFKQGEDRELKSLGEYYSKEEVHPFDDVDVFRLLMTGGTLDSLLSQGKEYILVLKSDNVATVLDPSPEDQDSGPSSSCQMLISFGRLVETKINTWVSLRAIKRFVDTVEVRQKKPSFSKFFDNVFGVSVPESRFLPLDATSDLLLLQSDLYTCREGVLTRNPARTNPLNPVIDLGPEFEKFGDFQSRFRSIPSIIELDSLMVRGDVWFGANITLKGQVTIAAKPGLKLEIPDGVTIENKVGCVLGEFVLFGLFFLSAFGLGIMGDQRPCRYLRMNVVEVAEIWFQ